MELIEASGTKNENNDDKESFVPGITALLSQFLYVETDAALHIAPFKLIFGFPFLILHYFNASDQSLTTTSDERRHEEILKRLDHPEKKSHQ